MITEIKRFIAVVDEGSVTNAAKKLFITQPALSLSLERLKKELKTKLFKTNGKRLVLTKDGEAVYTIGLQVIKYWNKAKDASARSDTSTSYSIGIFDNAALKLSKYFQKSFTQNGIKFEISIDRSADLVKGMQNGLYDICICIINQDLPLIKNYKLLKTFSEKLLPVSSKIWKIKITDVPFILYNAESSTRDYINKIFLKSEFKPNIIVESTSPTFMKELAIGNCGVALLPENFVKREIQLGKLKIQKLPFKFKRDFGLYLNKDSNLKESDKIINEIIENLI